MRIIIAFICLVNVSFASLLEEAKSHYYSVKKGEMEDEEYNISLTPSIRWDRYLNQAQNLISNCTYELKVLNFAQTPAYSGFDHRGDLCIEGVEANYNALLTTYPNFSAAIMELEDSPANVRYVTHYNGKNLTNTLFLASTYVFECLNFLKPNVVCEIGGGYGSPAYVWLTNKAHNPSIYIDIDYSESLFFAEVYLRSSLPDANFIYIDSAEKAASISTLDKTKTTIILCPLKFAELILHFPIDLVTNEGSLAEMNESAVDFWMNWIEKSKACYFYSWNAFCYPLANLSQSTNLYAPRMSENWTALSVKIDYEIPVIHLHTGYEIASLLFKREEIDNLTKEELKNRYWNFANKNMELSRKTLFECLDIIRITQDEKITQDVLFHIANGIKYLDSNIQLPYELSNYSYIPKESLFLAKLLISKSKDNQLDTKINEIEENLSRIYENALSGTP